jgi:glycine/D-amino acid oxidase-like deaminating enzyme
MAERHTPHGHWLEQTGPAAPLEPLRGEHRADVVIVGGGYTGMWTALHLRRLEPGLAIVLLEAGVCGEGPSGRNGGFVNTLWFSLPTLRDRFGDRAAIEVARAAQRSVGEIGSFCADHCPEAAFRQAGYLQVATAPGWDGQWRLALEACRELGEPDACRELTAEEVAARCASPVFRGGAFYPGSATVQPAALARSLRRVLVDQGVVICERTPVARVAPDGAGAVAEAPGGRVRAAAAVLASGGRLAAVPGLRRRLTLTSSHIVITEPVPGLLEEIGWTGGECITDSRAMIHYFRTTAEGRIAFGWGAGRVAFGARTGGRAELDPLVARQVEDHLRRFFPGIAGRRIEHAWGGPIDVSPSHLPVAGSLGGPIHYGFGYTGNGVGPSHMVARSLASLALGRDDEPRRLAIVGPPALHVPPEPFRFFGGTVIRRALMRSEAAIEEGRRPGPLTRFVAGIPERIGVHVGR